MKNAVGRLVNSSSNRHFHGYFWVWVVPLNLEVVNGEVLNVFHFPFDDNFGEGFWFPFQLLLEGFHVVEVDVGIPKGVDELAGLQAGHVSNHVSQQGIAGSKKRKMITLGYNQKTRELEVSDTLYSLISTNVHKGI